MKLLDLIGCASSAVLLATIMRQVHTQWKTKSTAAISHWLLVGQFTASAGFTVYSYLLHSGGFLTSNVALLTTAILGQVCISTIRTPPNLPLNHVNRCSVTAIFAPSMQRQLGYKHAKYLMRIEAVKDLNDISGGKGGFWEDRAYEWFAGI